MGGGSQVNFYLYKKVRGPEKISAMLNHCFDVFDQAGTSIKLLRILDNNNGIRLYFRSIAICYFDCDHSRSMASDL